MPRALLVSILTIVVAVVIGPALLTRAATTPDVFLVYSGGVFGQLGPCG